MRDPRLAKLARLLTEYSVGVAPGDWVLISGAVVALPLVREVYRAVLEAGGHPQVLLGDETVREISLRHASEEQLDWITPAAEFMVERVDAYFNLLGTENTRAQSGIDPDRIARREQAQRKMFERYVERIGAGELKWVLTQYPTQASAQEAGMSLADFEDFYFGACLVEEKDPLAAWQAVRESQTRWVDWLKGKQRVELLGPNVELRFSIEGRPFISCAGEDNMPDGEIFTSPVEDSANGWIRFSLPSVHMGREVSGVQLKFENGEVTEATAEKGEAFLRSQLELDEGASRLGEFAIGTNPAINRYMGDTLFDEKIGGTIHLALGHGIPEAGGQNKSALHWDLITDMKAGGRILVDGELVYDSGQFVADTA